MLQNMWPCLGPILTVRQCNMLCTSGLKMASCLLIIGEAEATLVGRILSDSPGGSTMGRNVVTPTACYIVVVITIVTLLDQFDKTIQ